MGGLHSPGVLMSVAVSLVSASLLSAQSTVRAGSEFQVNVVTVVSQYLPDVSADADGDFVVVWQRPAGGYRILARRFDPSGSPQGGEIQAEPSMPDLQINPAVSSDADGNFVVVWTNAISVAASDVFGRRFNAAGVPQATTFQVNIYTTYAQRYPAVAVDADGDFVVAWSSNYQDGGGNGVFARRFNSSGTAGPEFQVNSFTLTSQHNPSVGLEDNGDFVIVWQSDFQDESEGAIFGQRYNALGLLLGVEFQINSYTSLFQDSPRLDIDADGDFVVVWRSTPQDGSDGGVFAQRFNSLGAKLGVELQVNAFFTGEQGRPAVALRDAGDFVVVWHSNLQDGASYGVFGRHVSASGAPLGVEFQLGAFTAPFKIDRGSISTPGATS